MRYFLPFVIFILLIGCAKKQDENTISPIFSEMEGVERVSDSLPVYQYKDTLYYYNEASECLFKIPHGFKYAKGSDWDMDGVHFWNVDSTITINLTCLDRGFAKAEEVGGNGFIEEDILNQMACDNTDIRMFYEVSDKGYLKVGFTSDFIPMVEKCVAHFDNDDDMINEHFHIIRLVYADSLAKQACDINFDYIISWPNKCLNHISHWIENE